MLQSCYIVLSWETLRPKPTGVLEHYREGKNTGSPFFGIFFYLFPKATKYVNVLFFDHSLRDELIINNVLAVKCSCKLYQGILGTF